MIDDIEDNDNLGIKIRQPTEEELAASQITIYDKQLDAIPVEELFLYLGAKTLHLNDEDSQSQIGARSMAKVMKEMGYYSESISITQAAHQIWGEAYRLIQHNNFEELHRTMAVQTYSLNATYQYTLEKFVKNAKDAEKTETPPETRLLHYALMAQNMFVNTAQALREGLKPDEKPDHFSPYGR